MARYQGILKERAKLSFVSSRRIATTPYQTFLYQEGMDDMRMAIGELETEIAAAIFPDISSLARQHLELTVTKTLQTGKKKAMELPEPPKTPRQVRTILYRMYRGGSFYPLTFPREVELEFFRVLAGLISAEGMRGPEIANQARKLVLRSDLDLRAEILQGMRNSEHLVELGPVRWSWRRNSVVRRNAFTRPELEQQARKVASILDKAIALRQVVSSQTRVSGR
jgi:hypothetical protein